ncbi:hypothetical protein SynMEDNS5_00847 [Synechococcus sp. MEDNS5]|nr:hypothetical protein SynMEDNS5_00847 [Synechococcus sp. MEDNS5]
MWPLKGHFRSDIRGEQQALSGPYSLDPIAASDPEHIGRD